MARRAFALLDQDQDLYINFRDFARWLGTCQGTATVVRYTGVSQSGPEGRGLSGRDLEGAKMSTICGTLRTELANIALNMVMHLVSVMELNVIMNVVMQ